MTTETKPNNKLDNKPNYKPEEKPKNKPVNRFGTKPESKAEKKGFRIYIKPQTFSDCFIATMDPKDPFKICLYPSIKSQTNLESKLPAPEDELEQLILYNYLILRRDCLLD
ncbi:hypothetical protein [[Eubacterium] cellulosolvens]